MYRFSQKILSGLQGFRLILLLTASVGHALSTYATGIDSLRYNIQTRAAFSSDAHNPFWLVSNLQGLGSPLKNSGYVRAATFKDIDTDKRFSWGAGVDLVGAWRYPAPFQIHQLYGEIKYRAFHVLLGSKEMWCDHNDPRLSSGSLLYSGNALPIPQLRVGLFDYTAIPGTKNRLSVKAYLAYGMFTDSNWQKSWAAEGTKHTSDVLFHSKGLWLRFGNIQTFPVTGDVGIEMATQFAGTAYKDGKVVHMKHGLKEWIRVLFPSFKTHESFNGTTRSIEGNVVGQYTFGVNFKPVNANWGLRAYYEHMFEDHSMLTFEYGWKDGLWGLEATLPPNRFVSKIVYEFLTTKDQAGAVNSDSTDKMPEQVSGRDDYYNHSFYQGWQHWGMGIGNPLLISPLFNTDHNIYFHTNRIKGHHFGIAGNPTTEIDYRLLFSYTQNWGTYDKPLPDVLENFNTLLEINWKPRKLKGWYGGVGIALDGGDMLGKSFGLSITIGKTGLIRF